MCVQVCVCLFICVCVSHCPQVLESILGIGCVFLGISVSEKFGRSFAHKVIAEVIRRYRWDRQRPRTEQEAAEDTALGTQSLKVGQNKGDEPGQEGSMGRSRQRKGEHGASWEEWISRRVVTGTQER